MIFFQIFFLLLNILMKFCNINETYQLPWFDLIHIPNSETNVKFLEYFLHSNNLPRLTTVHLRPKIVYTNLYLRHSSTDQSGLIVLWYPSWLELVPSAKSRTPNREREIDSAEWHKTRAPNSVNLCY